MTSFWIRADGSASVGLGHVLRTVAIAEQAQALGHAVHYVVPDDPVIAAVLRRRALPSQALSALSDLGWLQNVHVGDVVVFDGYRFTGAEHEAAIQRGATVAVVDDARGGLFNAHVVINQNPVPHDSYDVRPGGQILLGPRYAMVRREFTTGAPARRQDLLLVTLGGSDAIGVTPHVLRVLDRERPFEHVRLVVGPAAPAPDVAGRPWLEVVRDPPVPAEAFGAAVAAVSAAGSTTWELLALGVAPALVAVADNQLVVRDGAVRAGAALDGGTPATVEDRLPGVLQALADADRREQVTAAGHELVDGQGAKRVVAALMAQTLGQDGNHDQQ